MTYVPDPIAVHNARQSAFYAAADAAGTNDRADVTSGSGYSASDYFEEYTFSVGTRVRALDNPWTEKPDLTGEVLPVGTEGTVTSLHAGDDPYCVRFDGKSGEWPMSADEIEEIQ